MPEKLADAMNTITWRFNEDDENPLWAAMFNLPFSFIDPDDDEPFVYKTDETADVWCAGHGGARDFTTLEEAQAFELRAYRDLGRIALADARAAMERLEAAFD